MDLARYRAQQGSFSPTPSNPTSNPDITITGSQSSASPTTTTFLYAPNPLLPAPRSILKSIPWGTEGQQHPPTSQYAAQSQTDSNSYSSPLASPSHLLTSSNLNRLPLPVPGAVGARGINGGLGGGFMGNVVHVRQGGRKVTPYRGFAYTPTRPSTGRLSRLTIGDPDRPCGFGCWFLFLFACCAILGLGGMWLFQVFIFAHHELPSV